jgi:putative ABC transport system permease protein
MGFWKTINIALIALKLNALRSFLTMLGIIIGIASVIVMVSVSSAPVGSSARMTEGLLANARAIATRCCWPPDNWVVS